jgi:hypothetical protein
MRKIIKSNFTSGRMLNKTTAITMNDKQSQLIIDVTRNNNSHFLDSSLHCVPFGMTIRACEKSEKAAAVCINKPPPLFIHLNNKCPVIPNPDSPCNRG